jgi:hypothetical protein
MTLWKSLCRYIFVGVVIALLCAGCAVTRDSQSGKWERVQGGTDSFQPDARWFSPGAFPDDMYQR